MTHRPNNSWWRTAWSWDAALSLAAGLVMFALLAGSDRPLLDGKPYLLAAIALGSSLGISCLVGSRWLTDHLNKDEYGEIVRKFDGDSKMTQRPYYLVAFASLALLLGAVGTIVSYENMPRLAVAGCYSALFGLAAYSVLGSVSLGLINYRHTTRASHVRAIKEQAARDARLQKSGQASNDESGN